MSGRRARLQPSFLKHRVSENTEESLRAPPLCPYSFTFCSGFQQLSKPKDVGGFGAAKLRKKAGAPILINLVEQTQGVTNYCARLAEDFTESFGRPGSFDQRRITQTLSLQTCLCVSLSAQVDSGGACPWVACQKTVGRITSS
jgi:hypothetical protein